MRASGFKPHAGNRGYGRIATILLLALGVGAAVTAYRFYHRQDRETTASTESERYQTDIVQKLMQGLAKDENRTFSDEQVILLKKGLSPHTGERVSIECALDDPKSCYLGLEIDTIFEASGWIVEELLLARRPTPGKAVLFRVKDASVMPRAEDLARLFASAGLPVTTQVDGDQMFDLRIVVPSNRLPGAPERKERRSHAVP